MTNLEITKYNPYPMCLEGVLLFMVFIIEIEQIQSTGLWLNEEKPFEQRLDM